MIEGWNDQINRVYDPAGLCPSLTTVSGGHVEVKIVQPCISPGRMNKRQNGRRFKEDGENSFTLMTNDIQGVKINDRVRKLTEREYWRLMDFTDEDFDKASKVCSRSQLYKQAGNSIVVSVLVAIFDKLLREKQQTRPLITKYTEVTA